MVKMKNMLSDQNNFNEQAFDYQTVAFTVVYIEYRTKEIML